MDHNRSNAKERGETEKSTIANREGECQTPRTAAKNLCGCNQLQRTRPGKGEKNSSTRESKPDSGMGNDHLGNVPSR